MSIPRRLRVLRRWYGEGPLHLLLMVSSFALAGYAGCGCSTGTPS